MRLTASKIILPILFLLTCLLVWYFYLSSPDTPKLAESPLLIEDQAVDDTSVSSQAAHSTAAANKKQPPALYENRSGSFEDVKLGSADISDADWTTYSSNGARATFSLVDGGVGSDGKALQVQIEKAGTQKEWDIQLVREQIYIHSQSLQRFSAWVNGPAGSEMVFSLESPKDYRLIKNNSVVLVGEWQQVFFEFDTQEEELRTAMHFSYPVNEGVSILVDDIKVEASK